MRQELEDLVRAGHFEDARARLAQCQWSQIPRADLPAIAGIARRVGLNQLSIRILRPYVRPVDEAFAGVPTAFEKIEYASSLRSLGMEAEAIEILSTIDSSIFPQVDFQMALCLIHRWNYAGAIPLLNRYIKSFQQPDYVVSVGKINLLDALIHERDIENANRLLQELETEIDGSQFPLLKFKTLSLAAKIAIERRDWMESERLLKMAQEYCSQNDRPLDDLLIQKWRAIARSLEGNSVSKSLIETKAKALELSDWETVRDCDFYIATLSGDIKLLAHVYFGTPFESFRRRIRESLGSNFLFPSVYEWYGSDESRSHIGIDLATGLDLDGKPLLVKGKETHRVLIALMSDFYKPVPPLSLFGRLFPGEYFDPVTSPDRIRQAIARFRKWVADQELPIALEFKANSYRLTTASPFLILVPRDPIPLDRREIEFEALCRALGPLQSDFSSQEAAEALGCSKATVNRLLKRAVDERRLFRDGHTHRTRYRRAI